MQFVEIGVLVVSSVVFCLVLAGILILWFLENGTFIRGSTSGLK